MRITWLGQACFKIKTESATIVIDPYDEKIGFALPKFPADLVLITHGHFDHANSAAFHDAKKIIAEPREYQFDNIAIKGISTFHDAVQGRQRGVNTIYKIESEGISLLHMGDFGESEMRTETLLEIGSIDILMLPIGGTYTIDGSQAAHIARQVNAAIAIPMHYLIEGLVIPLDGNQPFLDAWENADIQTMSELDIKKENLTQITSKVIVLSQIS